MLNIRTYCQTDWVPLSFWRVHPNVPVSLMVLIWPPAWRMSGWIDDSCSIKSMCSHACPMRKLTLPEEGSGTLSPPHASCQALRTLMQQECVAVPHKCEAVGRHAGCKDRWVIAWQSEDDGETEKARGKTEFLRVFFSQYPQAFPYLWSKFQTTDSFSQHSWPVTCHYL